MKTHRNSCTRKHTNRNGDVTDMLFLAPLAMVAFGVVGFLAVAQHYGKKLVRRMRCPPA